MKVKTFKSEYELVEFNHYIDNTNPDTQTNIIELLLNTKDIEYLENELSDIFAVITNKQTYIFSGYNVLEYYEENNGLIKVVCIK